MTLSLKTQNLPLIGIYIIFNIAIFLTLLNTGSIDINSIQDYFEQLSIKDGVFFSVLTLIIIVFGGIFSNKVKEIIVFWKLENRLPGCRAFSKYVQEDSRIDINNIQIKFGKIPNLPDEQNRYWYKIFKSIDDKSINKTHKDFLLCRELAVMTLLMMFLAALIFWFHGVAPALFYFCFLLFEYLIIRFCAKNSAERLVVNSLALGSLK
ncbi:hypothetical protein ACNSOO_09560 [Aliarcobacter lanthieri]|uniref:hypothetical protein n=1 Tax=Aliarcobacter lanthieri TaxID=1355374 RepID=UPI003AAE43B8